MIQIESGKKAKVNLNIAPLIDIIFLLLMFFMLSYHFVVNPGIKLTLPEAKTAKVHTQKEDIIIYITEDNELYLKDKSVGLGELLEHLKERLAKSEKKTVLIKADKKIDLGLAVKVMDVAKEAQAKGLIISTEIEKDEQQ